MPFSSYVLRYCFGICVSVRTYDISNQESRKKKIAKTSSTREVMEIGEANTSINLIKGYKILMFNKSSP